jgi:hypothetical protein
LQALEIRAFLVPQGRRAVEIVCHKESAIVIPGKLYRLIFVVGDAHNTCKGNMILEAFAGKETIKFPAE